MKAQTTGIRSAFRGRSTAFSVVVILCVVLLGVLAAAQVAHFHSSQTVSDHCPLCVSMHSAMPVAAAMVATIMLVQIGRSAPAYEQQVLLRRRNAKLFTRPPPAGL